MRSDKFLKSVVRIFSFLTILSGTVSTRRQKRCESSEIDMAGRQGVKVEPVSISRVVVGIEGRGIEDKGDEMRFQFKTRRPSGMLFYARRSSNDDEMIALRMENGHLFYTIICPYAHARLRLPIMTRMDDGHWHTVQFHRKRFQGFIELDKKTYFRHYPVNCGGFDSFVFGGIAPEDNNDVTRAVGKVDHFEGCLRNLETSVPFSNHISYTAVSVCK
ncbi:hypothetical protein SNE40_007713 [Patella caerulea]|uniref:Laminin G domain-containing protein n=1 Tax=Patella caerulea TaxID=87958 RepID=A0AAN8JXD2_PATCE